MASKPSKADREKRKREEQERLAALEAERLEQERLEEERRQEELRRQEEERQRKLEEEQKRFAEESKVLEELVHDQEETLRQVFDQTVQDDQWRHHADCDRSVDVTSLPALSLFTREWRDGEMESQSCLEETLKLHHEGSEIVSKLDRLLAEDGKLDQSKAPLYLEMRNSIWELMAVKLDEATQSLLATSGHHISTESFNLEKTAANREMIFHLWANIAKNPRLKSIDFTGSFPFSASIPKELVLANIGIRIIHSKHDTLSPTCKSFQMPKRKVKAEAESNATQPNDVPGTAAEGEGAETAETSTNKQSETSLSPSRQSLQAPGAETPATDVKAEEAEKTTEGEEAEKAPGNEDTAENGNEDGGDETETAGAQPVQDEDEFEEDDDLYDEHVVDLRNFRPLGGVVRLDLVVLPPQPKTYGAWTCQEIVSPELRYTTYPLPEVKSKQSEEEPPATPAPNSEKQGTKSQSMGNQTPSGKTKAGEVPSGPEKVDILFTVPGTVTFTEDPQIARWDGSAKQWRTDGFDDFNYDPDKQEASFKTVHLSSYALMQDLYANLPFLTWEIRPGEDDSVLLNVDTRICPVEIIVKEDRCQVAAKPKSDTDKDDEEEDMDSKPDPLDHLRGKWMTRQDFKEALVASGVNIFPFDDGTRFVSAARKIDSLETLAYQQMALLAAGFAFSCSRWNAEAGKEKCVVRYCVPPANEDMISEEHWKLCLLTEGRCFRLGCQENDEKFSDEIAEGAEPHPDLFNFCRLSPLLENFEAIRGASAITVHTVTKLISSMRLLVFS